DLRALPGCPEEEEEADRGDDGARVLELRSGREHLDEAERPQIHEDQHHRDEEAEIADPVDDERLLPRVGIRLLREPEADEEIRTEPDALPADEHQREGGT